MTKSTITRERIQRIIRAINSEAYDEEEIREWLSSDEIMELSRMALAAMDSEPDCKERKLFCSTDTTRMRKTISVSAGTEDAPLYRHAQQPVVSAELLHTAASAIEDLLTTKDRMGVYVCFDLPFRLRSAANAQPAPVVPDAYVRDEHGRMMLNGVCEPKIGFGTGWNACRAAMLAAAPQENN